MQATFPSTPTKTATPHRAGTPSSASPAQGYASGNGHSQSHTPYAQQPQAHPQPPYAAAQGSPPLGTSYTYPQPFYPPPPPPDYAGAQARSLDTASTAQSHAQTAQTASHAQAQTTQFQTQTTQFQAQTAQFQAQTAQALAHLTGLTQTLLATCTTLADLVRAQIEEGKVRTGILRRREERERGEGQGHGVGEGEGAGAEGTVMRPEGADATEANGRSQKTNLALELLANPEMNEEIRSVAAEYLKKLLQ